MKIPTVALVGRPNVGKSTLFNNLVRKNISIIEDTPGITRDRIYSECFHGTHRFHLIDTGGIDLTDGTMNEEIKMQVEIAINDADVVIFIIDGKEDITANDLKVKEMLMKSNKKVVVAINKMDTKLAKENIHSYYELGFDAYVPISAHHKMGLSDLLDEVVKEFPENIVEKEYDDSIIKFSIIGRPNVGKSSLVNALLNEERNIVSDIAGTTRDSIDSSFRYENEDFVVIDTAGMRKKGKVYENIEKYSLVRSMRAIDRSDVCVVVIDASSGIIEHDKHIAGYAIDAGKALVLVVNKWDLSEKTLKEFNTDIRNNFKFLAYVPIVFLSALTKKRIHTLMPEIIRVHGNSIKEVKSSLLNNVIMDAQILNPPPSYKGKRLKIFFSHQSGIKPPKFTLNVNNKGLVHFSYERYLENKIRESIDFEGTPITLQFKNKDEDWK